MNFKVFKLKRSSSEENTIILITTKILLYILLWSTCSHDHLHRILQVSPTKKKIWQKWRQELELYFTATEKDGKSDKIKTSILLTCIGKQGRDIYNTFQFVEGEEMKFKIVVQMFQDYCSPRKNITFLRHKLFTCKQRDGHVSWSQHGQSFDEFVTELKKRSAREGIIRDIIICWINDNRLRERLLREPELTLQKTIQIGHAAEMKRAPERSRWQEFCWRCS